MPATARVDAVLTDRDLEAIIAIVYRNSGITLDVRKRALVMARLQKRLRQHGLSRYSDYLRLLEQDATGDEMTFLLDAIATNHTSFFREPQHFDLLRDTVVPAFEQKARAGSLSGWCAASSTGEEPVTISITLREAGLANFTLLASDISTKALRVATRGVYPVDRVTASVPQPLLRKYFEKGLGEQAGLARVSREVRQHIEYRQLNLIEMPALGQRFDFIFCRNVMIYFDKEIQQRVVSMLESYLAPGGFMFISHSENLNGITHGLTWVAPAAYRKGAL